MVLEETLERVPWTARRSNQSILKEISPDCSSRTDVEAFAVISPLFARKYPTLAERYCPWGGALAYGHPYGASGAILLLHLWQELKRRKGRLGLLSIAGAGGLGTALLVKNCKV